MRFRTCFLFPLFAAVATAHGQAILRDVNDQAIPPAERIILPFAFYSGSTGLAAGIGGGSTGGLQPQNFFGAGGYIGLNGSYGIYATSHNLQLKPFDRLFLDATFGLTRWSESYEYIDGNPDYPGPAGTNDSDPDDFLDSDMLDMFVDLNLKFILPIGAARENPIATYTLKHGQLVSGATGGHSWWNPLESGRTYVELQPFAYRRKVNDNDGDFSADYQTGGARVALRWDNTDFHDNPTRGNEVTFTVGRDFGVFGTENAYTTLEFEYSHYIPLGTSDWFRQQVLALNLWTISETGGDAPYFTGAVIGGFERMRGYDTNRFHDRAAFVATAEVRLMLDYNPVKEFEQLDELARVDWVQLVIFGEVGRVAPSWGDELLEDVKWDLGVGIRAMARKAVVRADFAISEEGPSAWVMIGQSF